jgi:hypothetical protein
MSYSDKARVIENFMNELCKKHREAMKNGTSTKFQMTAILNQHLAGFERAFVDKVLKDYTGEGLIRMDKDSVELTKTGKQFCSDKFS